MPLVHGGHTLDELIIIDQFDKILFRVPMRCRLNVGTVSMRCRLNVGTVPTFKLSLINYEFSVVSDFKFSSYIATKSDRNSKFESRISQKSRKRKVK